MARPPLSATVALSAEQLEHAGVPLTMTEDDLSACVDKALLADDTALQLEIMQWVEDHG